MGKVFDGIDEKLAAWIAAQHMFFVATAPRSDAGLVNLSPKGLDSFAILGPRSVAYLDLVGSGAETLAHLRENGRITFMFCAFEGLPRIVRLYGRGEAIEPGDAGWDALAARFPALREHARDHPRRALAHRGLVRLRRPALRVQERPQPGRRVGGAEGPRRPPRLPARAEPREPRRAAGAAREDARRRLADRRRDQPRPRRSRSIAARARARGRRAHGRRDGGLLRLHPADRVREAAARDAAPRPGSRSASCSARS